MKIVIFTSEGHPQALKGVEMLQEMIDNLDHNKNFLNSLPRGKFKFGSYYSIPKKEAVEKFLKMGRKF